MAEELANKTDVIWMVCDKNRLENGKISDFTKLVITKTAQNPNIYAAMIVGSEEDNALNEAITQEIKTTGKQAVYVGVKSGVCEHGLADNVKVAEPRRKRPASSASLAAWRASPWPFTAAATGPRRCPATPPWALLGLGGGAGRLCHHGRMGRPAGLRAFAGQPCSHPQSGLGRHRQGDGYP